MSTHLINYSILESMQTTKSGDVFDHCGLFFLDVLFTQNRYERFTIEVASQIFKEFLNLDLPLSVVNLVLTRAKNKLNAFTLSNGEFSPIRKNVEDVVIPFKEKKEALLRENTKLIKSLVDYSKKEFDVVLDDLNAEQMLHAFLSKHQIEIVDYFTNFKSPEIKGKKIQNPDFLISTFLKTIYASENELFNYFVRLFKGVLVTNYLVSTPMRDNRDNLKNVIVLFRYPDHFRSIGI